MSHLIFICCTIIKIYDATILLNIAGVYDLPPDAKLQVKDMCRLFLCPTLIVPPTRAGYGQLLTSQLHFHSASGSGVGGSAADGMMMPVGWSKQAHERVWGVPIDSVTRTTATTRTTHMPVMSGSSASSSSNTAYPFTNNANSNHNNSTDYDYDDGDNGYDGGGGNDYGDDDYRTDYNYAVNDNNNGDISQQQAQQSSSGNSVGLQINTDNLLKAARTVDKVEIG